MPYDEVPAFITKVRAADGVAARLRLLGAPGPMQAPYAPLANASDTAPMAKTAGRENDRANIGYSFPYSG